jgi:hypothetical protein
MNKIGRPTKLTPETIKKLEEVFAMDGTVKEACFYADISTQTYYTFVNNNPDFLDRFEVLRERPVLKARRAIFDNLDDPKIAQWYLSRKRREEFSERQELQVQEYEPSQREKFARYSDEELIEMLKEAEENELKYSSSEISSPLDKTSNNTGLS